MTPPEAQATTAAPHTASTDRRDSRLIWQLRYVLDRRFKFRLVLVVIASTFLAALDSVAIVTVMPLVSVATGRPIDSGSLATVWHAVGEPSRVMFGLILVIAVVGMFVIKDLLFIALLWWQTGITVNERVRLSTTVLQTILDSPWGQFKQRSVSEANRLVDTSVTQTTGSLISGLLTLISSGFTIIALVAVLVVSTPLQALIAVVLFAIAALTYSRFIKPRVQDVGTGILEGSVASTLALLTALNGFKETKLRRSAPFFVKEYSNGITKLDQAARRGNFYSGITKYVFEILFVLGIGVLLVITFMTGTMGGAVSSLALFVAAGFRLLPNVASVIGAVNGVRIGRPALALIYNELRSREPAPAKGDVRALPFENSIELEAVSFSYPGSEKRVLDNVSLSIRAGESVAFVGGSGAGKTTIVDLILGLFEPTKGRLIVDGVDVRGREAEWQANCSMVAQQVFAQGASLRADILYDRPVEDADPERLAAAVRDAQLEPFVKELPKGLDEPMGDWGSRYSGGQKQRMGIARALYTAPKVLVLDEATSALDNETEKQITDTIDALRGRMTVLVVAHRLSTVKNADRVVFMKNGGIHGVGSFSELYATLPEFRRLVDLGDLSEAAGGSR